MGDLRFQLSRVMGAPVSTADLLIDMQRAAEVAGTKVLTMELYARYGIYDPTTPKRRFGSWNKALIAAGLQIANEINYSDERLFENIMRMWEMHGRQPRSTEMERSPSLITFGPYKRRFGTWMKALQQFVEFANSEGRILPSTVEASSGHRTGRSLLSEAAIQDT